MRNEEQKRRDAEYHRHKRRTAKALDYLREHPDLTNRLSTIHIRGRATSMSYDAIMSVLAQAVARHYETLSKKGPARPFSEYLDVLGRRGA